MIFLRITMTCYDSNMTIQNENLLGFVFCYLLYKYQITRPQAIICTIRGQKSIIVTAPFATMRLLRHKHIYAVTQEAYIREIPVIRPVKSKSP